MIKNASNILAANIPEEVAKEGYSFGDIQPEWIFNAMRQYAEQFIDAAAHEADFGIYQNDDGQEPFHHEDNIFVDTRGILELKKQIK